jgi:hypothetical protein
MAFVPLPLEPFGFRHTVQVQRPRKGPCKLRDKAIHPVGTLNQGAGLQLPESAPDVIQPATGPFEKLPDGGGAQAGYVLEVEGSGLADTPRSPTYPQKFPQTFTTIWILSPRG